MSVRREIEVLEVYCQGKGANIGCGHVRIGDSIGVDLSTTSRACDIVGDARHLPFANESLDYIVSAASFEHIDSSPIMTLREWLRCLKVGGLLALVVPDAEYGIWAMTGDTGECGKLVKKHRSMEHLHAFDKTTLKLLFQFAGMDVIVCQNIDRKPARPEITLLCVGRKREDFEY